MSNYRLVLENSADKLPSTDGVALAIMEGWDDENTSVPEMARLVETDPAMNGRLLRLANAAANGARPVVSIREAIARVGMRTVGQVAIAFVAPPDDIFAAALLARIGRLAPATIYPVGRRHLSPTSGNVSVSTITSFRTS